MRNSNRSRVAGKVVVLACLMYVVALRAGAADIPTDQVPCEDSTCARRVLGAVLPVKYSSSTSVSSTGVSAPVKITCTPSIRNNPAVLCDAGFTGTKYTTTTTSCPSGQSGAPSTTTSGYNTSGCVAEPLPVTCTPTSYANPAVACGSGYSGTKYSRTNVTCPYGSYGPSVTNISGYDTSGCAALVTCSPDYFTGPWTACGTGFTGSKRTVTQVTCPSGAYGASSTTTSEDTSNCVANAPPPANEPVVTCGRPQEYGNPKNNCIFEEMILHYGWRVCTGGVIEDVSWYDNFGPCPGS